MQLRSPAVVFHFMQPVGPHGRSRAICGTDKRALAAVMPQSPEAVPQPPAANPEAGQWTVGSGQIEEEVDAPRTDLSNVAADQRPLGTGGQVAARYYNWFAHISLPG